MANEAVRRSEFFSPEELLVTESSLRRLDYRDERLGALVADRTDQSF